MANEARTADQRLLSSIRYSLALTGTLFGGTASSLFYLLYRRLHALRRLYAFNEMTRWVDHYGLWERTWDQKEPLAGEYGAATGIQRWNYRQRELPGVGPGVIRYLLPITLFGNITDLGYELPPLFEDVDTIYMTPTQASQYEQVEKDLLQKALECMRSGDSGALSVWFNTVRFRPASAFRDELVEFTGRRGTNIHMELPSVLTRDQTWLPKEIRLAEIVRENMHNGRKTLVFVEQTGTRDMRPTWPAARCSRRSDTGGGSTSTQDCSSRVARPRGCYPSACRHSFPRKLLADAASQELSCLAGESGS